MLASQIMAQGTKVNPWKIQVTKVDIVSFVIPEFRTSVSANHLIYSLQSSRLNESVFLLVLGLGPFGRYHCPYPSGLALNHISTNLTWCSIPFHQHLPPKLIHTRRRGPWTLGGHMGCCHPYSNGLRLGDYRPLQDNVLDTLEPF